MTPPAPELTLPEELLLLALDPLRGKPYCSGATLEPLVSGVRGVHTFGGAMSRSRRIRWKVPRNSASWEH